MSGKRLRVWTLIFLLATLLCLSQRHICSKADGAEVPMFLLYPDAEEPFAWLIPEVSAPKAAYTAFAPAYDNAPETEEKFAVQGEVHVLIYHTHTTEAYRMEGEDVYEESGFSRTRNAQKNIIRIGEALKAQLEAQGFRVIHDTTDHEPPKLATAYTRSEQTMRYYQQKYPDMDIYIDVHRDAADIEKNKDDVVIIDGKRCARMMFVVGKGTKYDEKPDFEANFALAEALSAQLDTYHPKLTRDIRIKEGRYNQHIGDMCLLVEVGHNANTLQDALNSTAYLAKAMAEVVAIVD